MLFLLSETENNLTIANETVANGSTWDLTWDNFGKYFISVLNHIFVTILLLSLIVLFLRSFGYLTIGIIGGSLAAGFQSAHDTVVGSCFSCCHSIAIRLGRILIISVIVSTLVLFVTAIIGNNMEMRARRNSTLSNDTTSLNETESSVVDEIADFGRNTIQSVSALNASQAVNFIEDVSQNVASKVTEIFRGENATDSTQNNALVLQSDTVPQLLLLSLAMLLYFPA